MPSPSYPFYRMEDNIKSDLIGLRGMITGHEIFSTLEINFHVYLLDNSELHNSDEDMCIHTISQSNCKEMHQFIKVPDGVSNVKEIKISMKSGYGEGIERYFYQTIHLGVIEKNIVIVNGTLVETDDMGKNIRRLFNQSPRPIMIRP